MTQCPTHATLEAYERGELDDAVVPSVEGHMMGCSDCRTYMRELQQSDGQARRLRSIFREIPAAQASALTSAGTNGSDGALHCDGVNDQSTSLGKDVRHTEAEPWPIVDYQRVLLCGEGSYGSVWAVRDRVGVLRALKLVDLDRLRRANARCYEMTALENYCRKVPRHPYLIPVFHVGVVDHFLYYTMELADDQSGARASARELSPGYRPLTLDSLIRAQRLQGDVAIELARRLLRGLATLHSLGLIHRDIKPSNVIFVNRNPKLADIGVMTATGAGGKSVGTPRYMPPDHSVDPTADVFAFARMLHEMLAGRNSTTFPRLPAECRVSGMKWNMERVESVIVRASADRGAARYPDARAMLEDLEGAAEPVFGSLLTELATAQPLVHSRRSGAVMILLALIDKIPWIAGLVVVLYLVARLTR